MVISRNDEKPNNTENVGQFGAEIGTIGAYKQAYEYARDAEYWAKLSQKGINSIGELLEEVRRLYEKGELLEEDIRQLKIDFQKQDERLMVLIAQSNEAISDINNTVKTIDQKLIEIDKQLDVLLNMYVTTETLPAGADATGSFDPNTGEIKLGIPRGADGSVTDLENVPVGTPKEEDLGFFVEKESSSVRKANLVDIANLIPSVRSVSVEDGPKMIRDVVLTKEDFHLENVRNVASWSQGEDRIRLGRSQRMYSDLADAEEDMMQIIIDDGTFVRILDKGEDSVYKVSNDKLELVDKFGIVRTVNKLQPDKDGNVDVEGGGGGGSKGAFVGETIMFPYVPNNPSYPKGILPLDGSTLKRVDYPELFKKIEDKTLPSVTEEEWNNGAKAYYSLGDGSTTFRLPDWTTGEAIRSPNSTTDSGYKGKMSEQLPYIVTVNGQLPDDEGDVKVDATSLGLGTAAYKNIGIDQDAVMEVKNFAIGDEIEVTTSSDPIKVKSLKLLTTNKIDTNKIVQHPLSPKSDEILSTKGVRDYLAQKNSTDSFACGQLDIRSLSSIENSLFMSLTQGDSRSSSIGFFPFKDYTGSNMLVLKSRYIPDGGISYVDKEIITFPNKTGTVALTEEVAPVISDKNVTVGKLSVKGTDKYNVLDFYNDFDKSRNELSSSQKGSLTFNSYNPDGTLYGTLDLSAQAVGTVQVNPKGSKPIMDQDITIDSNGFLKKASPVIQIYSDGVFKTNRDSEGAEVERVEEGVYRITKVDGLYISKLSGALDGGFEVPVDENKQPMIWIQYIVEEDKSIIIKTYHRVHKDSPEFARNEKEGYENGDPIDIPIDRFILLKVNMPKDTKKQEEDNQ